MALKKYDVFVIGSGIAGQTVAEEASKNGLKVAIADNREFGGTCANRGCDSKKVLLSLEEALSISGKLVGKGITSLPRFSWKDLQKFKKTFTSAVPFSTERKLKNLGIDLYHQSPKFLNKTILSVEGKDVEASKIVIATGLVPRKLNITGDQHTLTSDDFLNLKKLPKSMTFIGAGYIGMEFACLANALGVDVTVIDRGNRPLRIFDEQLVNQLQQATEKKGIKYVFNAEVETIKKLRKNTRVHYKVDGKKKSVKARLIFNTTGRVPSLEDLDLENANIEHNSEGIIVNQFLQSISNKNVYACGDISNHGVPLTPFSTLEAKAVAYNLTNNRRKKIDTPSAPSVVFTSPQIAYVGMTEKEARRSGKNIEIIDKDASSWYSAKRLNENIYSSKIILDTETNKILGAHLIGKEAGEMINILALIITNGLTVKQVKETIFTYPTWGADIQHMIS